MNEHAIKICRLNDDDKAFKNTIKILSGLKNVKFNKWTSFQKKC